MAPPYETFWGAELVVTKVHLSLQFPERDQAVANRLATDLDNILAALCADNYAVEGHPAKPGDGECYAMLPLHEHCLFKLGIPLAELWYLSELAHWLRDHARNRFLLTAPPLRLPGAVGSPVTPVATV